jgi:hypothetical protein
MYGSSAGIPPNQVNRSQSAMKIQKNTLYKGRNTELCTVVAVMKGSKASTKIPPNRANTPANLLGIARRIA